MAVYPVVLTPARRPLVAAVGGVGILILAVALAGRSKPAVPWAAAAIGAAYAVALIERGGGVDPGAPVYAALLFASAELTDWSIDAPRSAAWDRVAALKRLRALAISTTLGAAGATVVVVTADLATAQPGVAPTVIGSICTVTFVGLLGMLTRHAGPPERR